MYVSKLDAARRQLESAIRLFFVYGDPIAIHTLTGAARTVLLDLARVEGREAGLDVAFQQTVRPERLDEVRRIVTRAQNFFKHADRDADELLAFNPTTTEILLWGGCWLYGALTEHRLPLLFVYQAWFALAHPHVLVREAQEEIAGLAGTFDTGDRRRFLEDMLPAAEQLLAGA